MPLKDNFNLKDGCVSVRDLLDPKEVHSKDFTGETFRVLKEKEVKRFGEYRTRRLVLEAWDRFEGKR